MRVFTHKAAFVAAANCVMERVAKCIQAHEGVTWENAMDNVRGTLGNYIHAHTMSVRKDDILALNAYKYGAPGAKYSMSKKGTYIVVPNSYVQLRSARLDGLSPEELIERLYPHKGCLLGEPIIAWLDAVHKCAPDMSCDKYYAAYQKVMSWLENGKGKCPTVGECMLAYAIIKNM